LKSEISNLKPWISRTASNVKNGARICERRFEISNIEFEILDFKNSAGFKKKAQGFANGDLKSQI